MIPAKLSLKNFMCYRDPPSPLSLEGLRIACICGDNGHGKSSLLDAITWALWGKARAKSADDLIHLGESDMEVELEFLVKDDRYRVIRKHSRGKRGRSGHSILELHVASDGLGQSFRAITANSLRETQAKIIDLLRMDYDTFVNSAFLRQGRADEFTIRTPKERKEVLAEILGLSTYDELEAAARKMSRGLEVEIAILEKDISDAEAELEKRPATEAEVVQVNSRLSEVEKNEALQKAQVETLSRRRDLLEAEKEELERIERRSQQQRRDLQQLREEIETYRQRRREYEQAVDQHASVEEGYQRYLDATQHKEEMDRKLARSSALVERRGHLEREIEKERTQLVGRRERLRTSVDHLNAKAANLEAWEEELVECSMRLAALDESEAELKERQKKLQEISAHVHHMETSNQQLMQEMQGLRGKVDMLVEGEAQCPLCGSSLGEDGLEHIRKAYERDGQEKKQTYLENQRLIKNLSTERDADQKELERKNTGLARDKKMIQGRISVLERDAGEGKRAKSELQGLHKELKEVDSQLSTNNFAVGLQQQLTAITSELDSLGYNAQAHQELRDLVEELKRFEELHRKVQEAESRLPEVGQALERAEARETRLREELEEDSRRRESIATELVTLPELERELQEARNIHVRLMEEQRQWRDRLAALQESIRRLKDLEETKRVKRTALKDATKRKGIYEELVHAFGKGGVQALIIETVLPEIEDEANRLLSRMTDNRMHVKIETQREKKSGGARETLDINIADELGTRPYELFSGGEAFRINLALRIALSKLLAHRAGAPLPILFIDEGFGTQDAGGREKLLEAINSIESDFERIIVITHIEELKDAFPVRIQVVKTEQGSTFSIN